MKYVDLFSGCGGLSLGVERAGGKLVLAVEKSDMAARTFFHNLIGDASSLLDWQSYVSLPLHRQIAGHLVVKELAVLLEEKSALAEIGAAGLDLVVGGPPCQGFSLAGRRKSDDIRNLLPWQYLDFVAATNPRAVVIENVVGMDHSFTSGEDSSFNQLQEALRRTGSGYLVQGVLVNAVHYGAPQHRPRLLIIGLRADVAKEKKITVTGDLWRSHYAGATGRAVPDLAPIPSVREENRYTLSNAVGDLLRMGINQQPESNYVQELNSTEWPIRHKSATPPNHEFRRHRPDTVTRFRLYQYLSTTGLNPKLLTQVAQLQYQPALAHISSELSGIVYPAVAPDGTVLANNSAEMIDLVLRLRTKKHSQKVLKWTEPARTVVTLPDDYVHPLEPRVFTVREMARFQGFPDSFEFLGKETTGSDRRRVEVPQYSQVGNAVSPWMSLAVGTRLTQILSN